jgi:hypothetical protein
MIKREECFSFCFELVLSVVVTPVVSFVFVYKINNVIS